MIDSVPLRVPPHHLQLYFIQHLPGGHYVAAWDVGDNIFASGWKANEPTYSGWTRGNLRHTIHERTGEAIVQGVEVDNLALNTWRRFDESYLDDALDVEQQCYCRYSLEVDNLPQEVVFSADKEMLLRFYSCDLTPELEAQMVRVFEFSRGMPPYCDYWFFNLDKIILGDYPLEKIPEHLRDIVKEARGE